MEQGAEVSYSRGCGSNADAGTERIAGTYTQNASAAVSATGESAPIAGTGKGPVKVTI